MLKDDLGKVKCATVLAKLGSSDVRIDASDDHTTRRWRIELQTELKSFFHKQQDAAAARVEAITASANQSDNNVEAIIQAALAFEWSELVEAAADPLYEAARSGMAHVLVQAGIVESANATDDDQRAAGYALLRAAEMAGMKWAQDELVEDPEAKWAFSVSSRNRIRSLVMRAFQEKTPITELGEKIKQAAAFSDANAETFAAMEIARAENWGVSEAWSACLAEMVPGKGHELALLYNLPEADRFAVEAEYETSARKGPRLAQYLRLLDEILADVAKSSRFAGPKTRAALNGVLMLLVEALPAVYALLDLRRNDRFAIVERWQQESLHLPARPWGIAPRTVVSSDERESHRRLTDPQQYTPALAQVLFERKWIKAMKEIASEPAPGTSQSSVNAYVCGAATKLLEYQRINEDKEYIDARESGQQLIALGDIVCPGEGVQRIGIEEIPDDLSSRANVVDYAAMPGRKSCASPCKCFMKATKWPKWPRRSALTANTFGRPSAALSSRWDQPRRKPLRTGLTIENFTRPRTRWISRQSSRNSVAGESQSWHRHRPSVLTLPAPTLPGKRGCIDRFG